MTNLQIICDSLADIPNEIINKYNIHVIPLTIRINNTDYKDGVDISPKEFYEILEKSSEMPKTSQATYIQFSEIFESYTSQDKKILYISGSSKVTGTYQSAIMAKNDLEGDIAIFDSLNLSYGCGAQVVKACEMNESGYSLDNIIKELENIRDNISVFFMVDTLEYLKKGGRISPAKAAVGSVLNIKPILEVKDGEVDKVAQVRGKKGAMNKIIELINSRYTDKLSSSNIAIGDGNNSSDLNKFEDLLVNNLNIDTPLHVEIGPSIGSHAGPKTIGICIY